MKSTGILRHPNWWIGMVLLGLLLLFAAPVRADTAYWSGTLNAASPVGNFMTPFSFDTWYACPYHAQPLFVSSSGTYTLSGVSTSPFMDTILYLYEGSFDPSNGRHHLIAFDDDSAGDLRPLITHVMQANVQYFAVTIPFGCGYVGTFTNQITGPGIVHLGYIGAIGGPPPDNRLNWQFGDDLAVLYVQQDAAGNPALHIYCVNANSAGVLGLVVTSADLAGIPDPPARNTLVAQSAVCAVSFWVLTTGEYQVNIRNTAGKVFVIVMQDLAGSGIYHQLLEP